MDKDRLNMLKIWSAFQEKHFLETGYRGVNVDMFKHLLPGYPINILDVGCGGGEGVQKLRDLGHHAFGVDMPGIVEKLWELYPDSCTYYFSSNLEFDELPKLGHKYDLILALGVIEHLINYERLFIMMAKALEKGGYLYLTTCNNTARELEEWHFHHFDEKELTRMAIKSKIMPVEFRRTSLTNLQATFRRDK